MLLPARHPCGTSGAGESQSVSAKVEVAYFNLADKQPELAELDTRLREHNRRRWDLLKQAAVLL